MIEKKIYKVSELNREARTTIESHFSLIEVEGEISNFIRARSGHLYFTLKDSFAQVRCAMFKMRAMHLRALPKDGMQVRLRARVSIYENRGDFQLNVDHLQETGDGLLQIAFEKLKTTLEQQGLFAQSHKKPIPTFPQTVGVITSAEGAAIRDIISVLRRRYPALRIIIYPTRVQGEGAATEIVRAISIANQRQECELLIIGRGGGSLEDLWAFNEEIVARAIYNSVLPTISAVGHEIDFTISDFVADLRAPTPSAAAELISPDSDALLKQTQHLYNRLQREIHSQHRHHQSRLQLASKQLKGPREQLQQRAQRLDDLELRFRQHLQNHLIHPKLALRSLSSRLHSNSPGKHLLLQQTRTQHIEQRLQSALKSRLQCENNRLSSLMQELDIVSPLATLKRGYAIARKDDKQIVRCSSDVTINEAIEIKLGEGELQCRVEKVS